MKDAENSNFQFVDVNSSNSTFKQGEKIYLFSYEDHPIPKEIYSYDIETFPWNFR